MAVSDNFNRADNPSLGANWTMVNGTIEILSNQAHGSTDGADNFAAYTGVSFANDHYAEVSIPVGSASTFKGPAVRLSGSGASRNAYFFNSGSGPGIYKQVSGTQTFLVAGTAPASGDIVRLEVIGTTLNYYLNGTLNATTTDGSLASGSAGIWIFDNAASATVDDFNAADVGGFTAKQRRTSGSRVGSRSQ